MQKFYRSLLTFIIGCIIFVLLPLLGWGLDDIKGYLANPARLGFIIAVILLSAYASIKIPEIGKKKNVGKIKIERQHLAIIFLQILSISLIIVAPYSDRRNILIISLNEIIRFIGLAFYIIGFIVMHIVEVRLGNQFSIEVTIQEDHKLITDGMFRFIRHPRYFGIIIFTLGLALIFKSWIAIILLLLIIFVLLWRIKDEEKMMYQEFGVRWEEYSKNTWRLIPLLF